MTIAKVEIDDADIDQKIESRFKAILKKMPLWPSVMTKQQAIAYSPFGQKRMNAAFDIYRKYLDEENGGCVYYPKAGQSYLVKRKGFDEFMDEYCTDIRTIDLDDYFKDKALYKANLNV